ncbi:DUF2797 domain-containing protein [Slackia sp.]|uniref:DUF2797 domain-containing protein n=1 Tax=Slackia sp. TaxID=2049041 RepID=UPI003A97ED7E
MPRFFPDSTLVFSGLGYGPDGPYLQMNDLEAKKQMRLPVLGRTFTMKKLPQRYCIGPFDLKTYESSACDLAAELPDESTYKDDMCPACREKTGFNPAFYNAESISPQQRAYNLTPHFVYMAYFSPAHLKVGISSETRGIERLLEQGARVAGILKRYPNADEARALEAHLCSQDGILETMRLGTKNRLLSEPFDAQAAMECVYETARRFDIEPECGVLDLTPYYFGKVDTIPDLIQVPDGSTEDVCGGCCVGMIGGTLAFEQEGNVFVVPVKDWETYAVEITVGEVLCEYEYEPQQMGLW